jgi:hypothetical protein
VLTVATLGLDTRTILMDYGNDCCRMLSASLFDKGYAEATVAVRCMTQVAMLSQIMRPQIMGRLPSQLV